MARSISPSAQESALGTTAGSQKTQLRRSSRWEHGSCRLVRSESRRPVHRPFGGAASVNQGVAGSVRVPFSRFEESGSLLGPSCRAAALYQRACLRIEDLFGASRGEVTPGVATACTSVGFAMSVGDLAAAVVCCVGELPLWVIVRKVSPQHNVCAGGPRLAGCLLCVVGKRVLVLGAPTRGGFDERAPRIEGCRRT